MMDLMLNYKHIFLYNKNNELITFVDLDDNSKLKNFYNLSDNFFTRYNIYTFKEKKKLKETIQKAKIKYLEDAVLFHVFFDGESSCRVVKKNSYSFEAPKSESKIYSFDDDNIEVYTINQNLMDNWLKKL